MKPSMRKPTLRPSACRLRILPALTERSQPSRSRSSRGTDTVRKRDFLEWPFFTPAHRELAERVDSWARQRFGGASAGDVHESAAHPEDRDSVDAGCRERVRDLG